MTAFARAKDGYLSTEFLYDLIHICMMIFKMASYIPVSVWYVATHTFRYVCKYTRLENCLIRFILENTSSFRIIKSQ